jgi:hypothetical protein
MAELSVSHGPSSNQAGSTSGAVRLSAAGPHRLVK